MKKTDSTPNSNCIACLVLLSAPVIGFIASDTINSKSHDLLRRSRPDTMSTHTHTHAHGNTTRLERAERQNCSQTQNQITHLAVCLCCKLTSSQLLTDCLLFSFDVYYSFYLHLWTAFLHLNISTCPMHLSEISEQSQLIKNHQTG